MCVEFETIGLLMPDDYAAFFCEENIWRLAMSRDVDSSFVLFFFNINGSVALCHQKPFEENGVGLWDYHVVLLDALRAEIFDYDTRLGSPISACCYLKATFPPQQQLAEAFQTTIRVVPAREYLLRFSSDRNHMLNENGKAMAPFPSWPAISAARPITLQQYISGDNIADSDSFVVALDAFDPIQLMRN